MIEHSDEVGSADSTASNEINPEAVDALQLAIECHKAGKLDAARRIYERIVEIAPDNADALHFLGMLSHQQGQTERGIELIRRAVAIDPRYASAFNNLGNLLKLRGPPSEAAKAYQRALELQPDAADTHNNLGIVLSELKQDEAALVSLRKAISLQPNHSEAYHNLGNVLRRMDRVAEAVTAYKKALSTRPYDGPSHRRLGSVLVALGRVDEAMEVYQQWLKKDPDNPVARYMLAACTGKNTPERTSDEVVKDLFDRFSHTFDNVLQRLQYRAPGLLGDAIREIYGLPEPTLDVLDAGCGTGLSGVVLKPYARRLVGVDLSNGMLQRAKERGIYDELLEGELTAVLQASEVQYDLIMSADTLCYFGALEDVVLAASKVLRKGGVLAFTVEATQPGDAPKGFHIQAHGRYAHTEQYLHACFDHANLKPIAIKNADLRMELHVPVRGFVATARKPD